MGKIARMELDGQSLDYEPVIPSRAERQPRTDSEESNQKVSERADPGQPAQGALARDAKGQAWSLKRGHTLTFVTLALYTVMAYFRPFELSPVFAWTVWLPFWTAIVMLVVFVPSQLAREGTLTERPREVNLSLLLWAIALLSVLQALDPAKAWETFIFLSKTIIFFIVMVNVMSTEWRLRVMMFLALAAGCFMSATALSNYAVAKTGAVEARATAEISNMFGEPNSLALHMVTMIPLAIALLLSTRNIFKKVVYGVGALLMVTATFATLSRGGFLGLLAAGLVLAWKLGRRHRLAAMGLIAVGVLALVFLTPGGYKARLDSILDPSLDVVGSSQGRRALLTRSIGVALTSPFLGVGIGNLRIVLIRDAVSHNAYTQVAAEMGMVAFVLYVMFMITPYKRLLRIERETREESQRTRFYCFAVGLQASLIGYMVGSFFLSVAYESYVYLLVGLALCLHRLYESEQGTKIVEAPA